MPKIKVTLHGAVPEKIGDRELVTLTGSATVVDINGYKILGDLGLFQGGEGAELFNQENIKFIDELDGGFFTHSHIDHIGRGPLLWKIGFRGPIYMTEPTKEITFDMLQDCLKIQQGDAIIREKKNKNLASRLKKSLELKEKITLESGKKKRYTEQNIKDLNEIQEYLDFYGVKSEKDIEGVLLSLKQTLFTEDDIAGFMSLIKTANYNEEILFDSKKISSINDNREDQELLCNLPRKIAEGHIMRLKVDKEQELKDLKKRWVIDLIKEVQKVLNNKELRFKDINADLSKDLQKAYTYCYNEYPAYLQGNKGLQKTDNLIYLRNFNESSDLLKTYGINTRHDIDDLFLKTKGFIDLLKSENPTKIIEKGFNSKNKGIDSTIDTLKKIISTFDLAVPFDTNHIDKAINSINVLHKKTQYTNKVSLLFGDAAHLVGSSNVTLTLEGTNKKVNDILNIGPDSVSIFLSGDMGRIEDNILGRPQIPKKPVNYLQIESTYGGKVSFKKEEVADEMVKIIYGEVAIEEDELIDILFNLSYGKTHLEETELLVKLQELINKKENLGKEGLTNELIKILNVKGHRSLDESLKEIFELIKNSKGNILGSMFSQQRLQAFLLFFEEKLRTGDELGDFEIVIDAPLGKKVLSHYLKYAPEVYGVLEGLLKEGKVRFLEEGEWESLYLDENKDKKYIILASSGMMDGGAIMNHLPKILPDENATLFAPGYLSRGTLGNEIIWGEKNSVKINGESVLINCTKKYIEGFSSHIGHDEILQYLTETINAGMLKIGATIALSHGNIEGQLELKQDIESILIELNRTDIIVTIPGLFDEYDVLNRTFNIIQDDTLDISKNSVNSESKKDKKIEKGGKRKTSEKVITDIVENDDETEGEKIISKKPVEIEKRKFKRAFVPTIVRESEKIEEKNKQESIPQEVLEWQLKNSKEISLIKLKRDILTRSKNSFGKKHLDNLLNTNGIKDIDSVFSNISKLSQVQKQMFYDIVFSREIDIDTLDKQISNFGTKIHKISETKDYMINFFESTKVTICNEITELKTSLEVYKNIEKLLEVNLEYLKNLDLEKYNEFTINIKRGLEETLEYLENIDLEKNNESIINIKKLLKRNLEYLENIEGKNDNETIINVTIKTIKEITKSKDKKIKQIKSNIKKIKNDINYTQNNIYTEMLSLLPQENHNDFELLFNKFRDDIIINFKNSNKSIISKIDKLEKSLLNSVKQNKKLKLELSELENSIGEKDEVLKNNIKDLISRIKGTNKKIRHIKNDIKILRKELTDSINTLNKGNEELIMQDNLDDFEIVFNNLLKSNNSNLLTQFNQFLNKITSSYKSIIFDTESEKKQLKEIQINKLEASFNGIDMYSDLLDDELFKKVELLENEIKRASKTIHDFTTNNKEELDEIDTEKVEKLKQELKEIKLKTKEEKDKNLYETNKKLDINLEKLEEYIKKSKFSSSELVNINSFMSIIKSSDSSKKDKIYAKNNLITYFREEKNKNKNLGEDITIKIKELNDSILLVLSKVFDKSYYESNIKNNFDIYSFLKSKKTLNDYIFSKYSKEKLNGILERNNIFTSLDNHVGELFNILDRLKETSNKSKTVYELNIINSLIERIGLYIDNFIKQDFNDLEKQSFNDFINQKELASIMEGIKFSPIVKELSEEKFGEEILLNIPGVIDFVKEELKRLSL